MIEVAASDGVELELASESEHMVVSGVDRLCAEFTELTIGEVAVNRPEPAADPLASFEHHDVVPGVAKATSDHETRQAGTHYDNLHPDSPGLQRAGDGDLDHAVQRDVFDDLERPHLSPRLLVGVRTPAGVAYHGACNRIGGEPVAPGSAARTALQGRSVVLHERPPREHTTDELPIRVTTAVQSIDHSGRVEIDRPVLDGDDVRVALDEHP